LSSGHSFPVLTTPPTCFLSHSYSSSSKWFAGRRVFLLVIVIVIIIIIVRILRRQLVRQSEPFFL
jgi:hypothetical protein